jgi:hypothetical protein
VAWRLIKHGNGEPITADELISFLMLKSLLIRALQLNVQGLRS